MKHPIRFYERVAVAVLAAGLLAGFLPSPPPASAAEWIVCVEIGFIPSWRWCKTFGKPKLAPAEPPAPCPVPPSVCDPNIQSCNPTN